MHFLLIVLFIIVSASFLSRGRAMEEEPSNAMFFSFTQPASIVLSMPTLQLHQPLLCYYPFPQKYKNLSFHCFWLSPPAWMECVLSGFCKGAQHSTEIPRIKEQKGKTPISHSDSDYHLTPPVLSWVLQSGYGSLQVLTVSACPEHKRKQCPWQPPNQGHQLLWQCFCHHVKHTEGHREWVVFVEIVP